MPSVNIMSMFSHPHDLPQGDLSPIPSRGHPLPPIAASRRLSRSNLIASRLTFFSSSSYVKFRVPTGHFLPTPSVAYSPRHEAKPTADGEPAGSPRGRGSDLRQALVHLAPAALGCRAPAQDPAAGLPRQVCLAIVDQQPSVPPPPFPRPPCCFYACLLGKE